MPTDENCDHDLSEMIDNLVSNGVLIKGKPSHGIAQQAIHGGYDSLSLKQKSVFDRKIQPHLKKIAERIEREEKND